MDSDITRNYHRGDPYSDAAYASLPKPRRALDRERILRHIRDHGPATSEQLETHLGLSHQTCSARISELRKDAQLIEVGRSRTSSGRSARIHGIPT